MDTTENYVTVKELATELRVDRSSIYRLCNSGRLASVRIGKSLRIPASDARALLNPEKSTTDEA